MEHSTKLHPLDHLAMACAVARVSGKEAIRDYFRHKMTDADRLRFDGFLVIAQDPLAFRHGPCEERFFRRVDSMLTLRQTGQFAPDSA